MSANNMTVIVTGGAGFIGSHLVDALIDVGARVVVIDNLSTGKIENVNRNAAFHQLDICSEQLSAVIENESPSIVYHLASNTNVPGSIRDPRQDFESLSGALNVIDQCRRHGVDRFIFTSSGFIYGNTPQRPIQESEPFKPISPYAISKKAVEHYLQFYHEVYGLEYLVLRLATVYGPRQTGGAMADYIRRLSRDEQAEMYGDGTKTRDYVYVEDVVSALLRARDVPKLPSVPVFNISSANETTLNEVYHWIARLLQKEAQPVFRPDRPGELDGYSLDYSLAKKHLHWEPTIALEEGLRLTLQYWREGVS